MIKCLAIDDEELSLDLLEDNIRQVPYLHLVKRCQNAFEAMEIMQHESIDLLFLDIQMPGLMGTQFVQSLQQKPMVIFITAYRKYALEGFELDVLDYLVKPVTLERFIKASNKAAEFHQLKQIPSQLPSDSTASDYLFVSSDYNLVKIVVGDILFIEGLKDYIKIHLEGKPKPIITKLSMKTLSDKLPQTKFARIHKSFIVAIGKITYIRKNRVYITDHVIPISDFYRENIFNIIGSASR